jgi:hypothetical protein
VVWAVFASGPVVPVAPSRQAAWEAVAGDGSLPGVADQDQGGYPATSAYLRRAARAHRHRGPRIGRRRFG